MALHCPYQQFLLFYSLVERRIISEVYNKKKTKVNVIQGSEDLITEMFYFSEDNKGNKYEIKSEYGIINPDKSNLILSTLGSFP